MRRGDDKSYTIHSMADSSLYLTQAGNIDQDLVWLTVNSASNANRWYFYETIYGYLIRPACSRTRVLDVYGMSSGPGVWNWDISSFTFLGGVNQGWMLERVPEPDSPLEFQVLHGAGLLSYAQIQNTADDFYICTKSLADILVAAGIPTLYDTENEQLTPPVHGFYDDWYLFAVPKAKGYTIGLFKMREQEDDAYDNNDPGVTISFVAFDFDLFYMCLRSKIKEDCLALNSEIDKVTSDKGVQYDGVMQAYFSNPASEGAYLIVEAYVKFMAGTAVNRTLAAPDQYLSLLKKIEDIDVLINSTWDGNIIAAAMAEKEKLSRIPDALAANNQAAGYAIFSDNTIHLLSRNSPTTREAYAILMLHTANVNYNSFAAEVKFHSDALVAPWADIDKWYDSALRADMAIGEEAESGFFDKYYDLEGDLVQEQIQYHGER